MMLPGNHPDTWLHVSGLIARTLGLHYPPERLPDLRRGLESAARELGLADAAQCAARLLRGEPTPDELQVLARHLTIGETYFFRDPRIFDALRDRILPPLLAERRAQGRRLRLWSAGCCTGEEPYSLAMLLRELIPDIDAWNVTLLATDLNASFLQKASAAVYGEWSFRGVEPGVKASCFRPAGERRFALRAPVRRMVTFAQLNLAQDLFPSIASDTNAMDIIFCRNVLMYFTPEQMQRAVEKLRRALLPGGWLVVSPSEASHALFPGFTSVIFPGAVLFRRDGGATAHAAAPMQTAASMPKPASLPLSQRASFLAPERARETREPAAAPAAATPAPGGPDFAAQALACANEGDLDGALRWCDRWVEARKMDPGAHFLRGMVLLEKGDAAEASRALQRSIYLDPGHVMAHVSLANLERSRGLDASARGHLLNALRIARRMAPDTPIADGDGLTAGRLAETLAALTSRAAA